MNTLLVTLIGSLLLATLSQAAAPMPPKYEIDNNKSLEENITAFLGELKAYIVSIVKHADMKKYHIDTNLELVLAYNTLKDKKKKTWDDVSGVLVKLGERDLPAQFMPLPANSMAPINSGRSIADQGVFFGLSLSTSP